MKKKATQHYVDNKKFLEAMVIYKDKVNSAKENNRKKPDVTNYIGECFLKIANHLSYRPNFINYTYRDDMISDGIENCLQYMTILIQLNQLIRLHILHKLYTMHLLDEYKKRKNNNK